MLDLILIDVQYKESIVSSIEKGFNEIFGKLKGMKYILLASNVAVVSKVASIQWTILGKSRRNPWNYRFFFPMAEIPDKTKYHIKKVRQKSGTSSHKIVYFGNSHCFFINQPLEIPHAFSQYPWKLDALNSTVFFFFFFWNKPVNGNK